MRRLLLVVLAGFGPLVAGLGPGADAVEVQLDLDVIELDARGDDTDAVSDHGRRAIPGRADPQGVAPARAYRIRWDDYISNVVVEGGEPGQRRAWVSTHDKATGDLQVSYCGMAFIDAFGDIHIDCQQVSSIGGPMASQWWPDSFAIQEDGVVRVMDDQNHGNLGRLLEQVSGERGVADEEWRRYRKALDLVRALVQGFL